MDIAYKKLVGGQTIDMTPDEKDQYDSDSAYAPTLAGAKQRKRGEALTIAKRLYQSVDPIEGDPAAYLVTLKADWTRMKNEVQDLTTVKEIRDYAFTFTPAP